MSRIVKALLAGVVAGLVAAALVGGFRPAQASTDQPRDDHQASRDEVVLSDLWDDMACNQPDSQDEELAEGYFTSVLVGTDSEGNLLGVASDAARGPREGINGVSKQRIEDMVLLSANDDQAIFAAMNSDGRPETLVLVSNFFGQWVATEGMFCSADDIYYQR